MSEFSTHQTERLTHLTELFDAIVNKDQASETILKYQETTIANVTPDDVVVFVHNLVESDYPMETIKSGINKLLNVLRRTLDAHPYKAPADDTFFYVCIKNNEEAVNRLNAIRPFIHKINKEEFSREYKDELIKLWSDLQSFMDYYLIKENILFPLLEESLPDFRCIMVMWSIHDDIRRDLKLLVDELGKTDSDLKLVNRLTGDLFYNIFALEFREERLLFPFIEKHIPADQIEALWNESVESGFPYLNPDKREEQEEQESEMPGGLVDLGTGLMTPEQILLVFNHLPVDITYVDENDRVVFFSTPKDRIFHRTKAVIGRDVHNCHPKESVHVVEQIVDAFKTKRKDSASFWISMRTGKRVLIQYFAVRDEAGEYRGVIEVSQEISEIQKLEGDRRILDWED